MNVQTICRLVKRLLEDTGQPSPITYSIIMFSVLCFGRQAVAGTVIEYPYQQYANKSDLIVIAEASARTKDTPETTDVPNMGSLKLDGTLSPIPARGVETTFKVLSTLKGDQDMTNLTLHHYRYNGNKAFINGPPLPTFDPDDKQKTHTFLMFLVREPDGRFAPALDTVAISKSICPMPGDYPPPPPPQPPAALPHQYFLP